MENVSKNTLKHKKNFKSNYLPKLIAFIILLVVCVIWLIPLIWMLGSSFKTTEEIISSSSNLFTHNFSRSFSEFFENYISLFDPSKMGGYGKDGSTLAGGFPMYKWVINSSIVCVFTVILDLIVDTLGAYAFTFLDFKFKGFIWAVIIASMTVPGVCTFVATYAIEMAIGKVVGLTQIYLFILLIVPSTCGVFNLFLTRQFFLSIPKDLVESARIDGATDIEIFIKLILPLAKSVLIVVGLFAFTGAWNSYMGPQLLMASFGGNVDWLTVAVGLSAYGTSDDVFYLGRNMAASVIAAVPVLLIYIFCQDRIIEGVATTGVKG